MFSGFGKCFLGFDSDEQRGQALLPCLPASKHTLQRPLVKLEDFLANIACDLYSAIRATVEMALSICKHWTKEEVDGHKHVWRAGGL